MRRRGMSKAHIALAAFSAGIAMLLAWPAFTYWREQRAGEGVVDLRRVDVGELPVYQPPANPGSPAPASPAPAAAAPAVASAYPPIPLEHAVKLFTIDDLSTYDPLCGFRHNSHLDLHRPWMEHPEGAWRLKTNSLGMREDREPSELPPKLRILVTGDSHTDGVCNNAESFAHVLEALLLRSRPPSSGAPEVEVLNTGKGGYTFYNYLGVLERYRDLAPQAFVVAVYGGNDFEEAIAIHHYYRGTRRPSGARAWPQIEKALAVNKPAIAQFFLSLKFFADDPGQQPVALEAALETTQRMKEECERRNVRLIVLYIPPVSDVTPLLRPLRFQRICQILGLDAEKIRSTENLADAYLVQLQQSGVETIDFRPLFRLSKQPLYWVTDLHINLNAHRLIAEELRKRFEPPGNGR